MVKTTAGGGGGGLNLNLRGVEDGEDDEREGEG